MKDNAFFLGKSGLLQKFLYKKAYSSNNNSNNNSAYYYNGTVNKTLADELLPKTGTDMARWVLPVVIGIFIISYFNYRRYRDIKIK